MSPFRNLTFSHCGRLTLVALLTLAVVLLAGAPTSAAPLSQGTIHHVYISDVRNTSFVVSWTTELLSTASVTYGPTAALGSSKTDTLNPTTTTTHYVTVSGLTPDTTYYLDVVSGSVVDNNGGAHYTVTTGPTLSSVPGTTITGIVYQSNGTTPVPYAIVYLQVRHLGVDSQLVALRTADPGGQWNYNLSNLRTADNQNWFPWAVGDTITLTGQGGALGTGQLLHRSRHPPAAWATLP